MPKRKSAEAVEAPRAAENVSGGLPLLASPKFLSCSLVFIQEPEDVEMEAVDSETKPAVQLATFNAERMAEVDDIDKEDEVS
jgi:hypothetical protein